MSEVNSKSALSTGVALRRSGRPVKLSEKLLDVDNAERFGILQMKRLFKSEGIDNEGAALKRQRGPAIEKPGTYSIYASSGKNASDSAQIAGEGTGMDMGPTEGERISTGMSLRQLIISVIYEMVWLPERLTNTSQCWHVDGVQVDEFPGFDLGSQVEKAFRADGIVNEGEFRYCLQFVF